MSGGISVHRFFFTFGCDFPLADYVQIVIAPDEKTARAGMFRYYADRWCACYSNLADIGGTHTLLPRVIKAVSENHITCKEGF